MSDVNSEPSTPSPLTPHLDLDRNRIEFFDMVQSPTGSDTMLLTPSGSPTPDGNRMAYRTSQNMPRVGLGIYDSHGGTEIDLLKVRAHLYQFRTAD